MENIQNRWIKIKDYKNVLVVAHSGVSKAFDGYFEGIKKVCS